MTNLPFFVYGTLRPGHGNYAWALRGHTSHETPGTLTGALMHDNGGFPFVTREGATEADTVTGDLVTVPDDLYATVMANLDRLEGFHGPNAPQNLYDRVQVTIDTADGPVTAWTYLTGANVYRTRVHRLPLIASGDWNQHKAPLARA